MKYDVNAVHMHLKGFFVAEWSGDESGTFNSDKLYERNVPMLIVYVPQSLLIILQPVSLHKTTEPQL